jgi:hypothetical protein
MNAISSLLTLRSNDLTYLLMFVADGVGCYYSLKLVWRNVR